MPERTRVITEKLICEVRYRTFNFLDRGFSICEELGLFDKFSTVSYNLDPPRIEFRDDSIEPKIYLQFASFKAAVLTIEPGVFENFEKNVWPLRDFVKKLDLSNEIIDRFGIRAFGLLESVNFKKLKDEIFDKFYKSTNIFEGEVQDLAYVVVINEGGLEFRLEMGPLLQQEIKKRFPFKRNIPLAGLLIDIDCYKKNLKIQEINSLLKEAKKVISKIFGKFESSFS